MALEIKIYLKRVVRDMELMGLVYKELTANLQYFSTKKNNSNNFVITLCKYLLFRTENPKALKIISDIINNPKLEINNVKLELLNKYMDETEFKQMFDEKGNIISKKFKSKCRKYSINFYKINQTIKKHLQKLLNNKELIYMVKDEKPLNIILDNARIHTAKIVKEACEILSINLVYLPPYCPFLSPIEDVWKDVKRDIYNTNHKTLDELINLFELKFYEKVDNVSYFENWVMKFFEVNIS